jgi:dTDP-4-amino-4,6-dideoxygalactose transaminase
VKSSVYDLAIFGGVPAFDKKLHVGQPNIDGAERLLERIKDMLDRKWLTNNGPYVQEFERRIADLVSVKHCIAMCNATAALEIAIRAAGLSGEVIVPSFTFIATAHALQWQEITPVFCDVDPLTHNIDPRRVEQMITPRTTGIIGVHLWGRPCDVQALFEIGRRHNLKLLFDAAQAFGASHKGRMIGSFGSAEVFSFHATKVLNTFEGGAVVTDDDELACRIRLMKNFGFADYDAVVHVGTNGKMSEACAAMGLTSLESIDKFIAVNRRNYREYKEQLADIPGVGLLAYDESEKSNFHYIVLEIDEAQTRISRDQLQEVLWAEKILARRYFYPGCHRMQPYRSYFPNAGLLLPNTERLAGQVLCLPTGTGINAEDISQICRIIRLAVENGQVVKERFALGAARDMRAH